MAKRRGKRIEDALARAMWRAPAGDGAFGRIRTDDLRITNAPLCQLSYEGPRPLF